MPLIRYNFILSTGGDHMCESEPIWIGPLRKKLWSKCCAFDQSISLGRALSFPCEQIRMGFCLFCSHPFHCFIIKLLFLGYGLKWFILNKWAQSYPFPFRREPLEQIPVPALIVSVCQLSFYFTLGHSLTAKNGLKILWSTFPSPKRCLHCQITHPCWYPRYIIPLPPGVEVITNSQKGGGKSKKDRSKSPHFCNTNRSRRKRKTNRWGRERKQQ